MAHKIYAIRTLSVAKYDHNVRCPFQEGAYMAEYHNDYAGRSLTTVYSLKDATFYDNKREAQEMLKLCTNWGAKFEIVEFEEK